MAALVLTKAEKMGSGGGNEVERAEEMACLTQAQSPGFRSWHTHKSHVPQCISVFPRMKGQDWAH